MVTASPRTLLRSSLTALVLGGLLLSGQPQATADPMADAQRKAQVLRTQVDELRHRAEVAAEDYDAAYVKLGAAVTAHLSSERDLALAQDAAGASDAQAGRRVRALYMYGGTAGLYAHVLDSASISEVAQRMHQVRVVLDGDHRSSTAAGIAVLSRVAAEQRLAESAAASTSLQKVVADRADRVTSLLAQADALLSAADGEVIALAEQQRQQAAAAAAIRDAEVLAAARAAAGDLPDVAATPVAAAALKFARAQLGKPYLWGATGPDSYDCSGLTLLAYRAAGVNLPRTSREQWFAGQHVELGGLMPGDLMFWADDLNAPGTIHHVALYAGAGMMVAAPHSGDVVKVQPVYLQGYMGAVRPGVSP